MKLLSCIRRPTPFWASVALLVAVSGALALGASRQEARRVRVGGTRGVGVIHQVRVEPYGRAAGERAFFDDDEIEALKGDGRGGAPLHAWLVFLSSAAALPSPAAWSRLAFLALHHPLFSADRAGLPLGRAPPLA